MKTKIKKTIQPILLGLAVLGAALAVQSFGEKYADVNWYFTGHNASEITDVSKWDMADPGLSGCSPLSTQLPCELKAPSQVNDEEELEIYFEEKFENSSSAITQAASTRRNLTSIK